MNKRTIYVIFGCTHYEGDDPIIAFESEAAATAACAAWDSYHKARPEIGEEDGFKSLEAWREKHPGGELGWISDYFQVLPLELVSG